VTSQPEVTSPSVGVVSSQQQYAPMGHVMEPATNQQLASISAPAGPQLPPVGVAFQCQS